MDPSSGLPDLPDLREKTATFRSDAGDLWTLWMLISLEIHGISRIFIGF
jgi:hypothetical protein